MRDLICKKADRRTRNISSTAIHTPIAIAVGMSKFLAHAQPHVASHCESEG
ncbi:hypothetical protein [Chamaesiphon polymorphus]|uniref:hypothetical protein n=1 Tax=Chamaesiphon polymorphus TaxID=2107691 RepID=UPI0015E77EB4|nr:hypothetical protein [Chamaesiphon polymorphus]